MIWTSPIWSLKPETCFNTEKNPSFNQKSWLTWSTVKKESSFDSQSKISYWKVSQKLILCCFHWICYWLKTKYRFQNFFVLSIAVVAIQKIDSLASSLFKLRQQQTSKQISLVFGFLSPADATKETLNVENCWKVKRLTLLTCNTIN